MSERQGDRETRGQGEMGRGFVIWELGSGTWNLDFGIWDLEFRFWDLGFEF